MKHLLALLLICSSFVANATEALSKETMQSFFDTAKGFEQLKSKYPDVLQKLEKMGQFEPQKTIEYIKNSPAYPDVKAILAQADIKDLETLMALSQRIVGSVYSAHMQRSPEMEAQLNAIKAAQLDHIEKMKKAGLPESVIAEMQAKLAETSIQNELMNKAVKSASKADIKFVKDNLDWVMSLMAEVEQ